MDDQTISILFGKEFLSFWREVEPYTMVSEERAYATYKACRHICMKCIPGAFVECGVYLGGMAMLAALTFARHSNVERDIWLYDTFSGMTSPEAVDCDRSGLTAEEALRLEPHMCLADLTAVEQNLASVNYCHGQVRFVKGDVCETLSTRKSLPNRIGVLRLDTDWYASTHKELEALFPRVVTGGVTLVDDYGHWLGARLALDEFLEKANPPIYLARTDTTGVEFVKPARRWFPMSLSWPRPKQRAV